MSGRSERPWTLEGLAAMRVLLAANAPLAHIGEALDRLGRDIDRASWILVGRSPAQALAVLNGTLEQGSAA